MSQPEIKPGCYRYRLKNLNGSSARYGVCEVCGCDVAEVWIQTEERSYDRPPTHRRGSGIGWTMSGCVDLFGHRGCLEAKQRAPLHHVEVKGVSNAVAPETALFSAWREA